MDPFERGILEFSFRRGLFEPGDSLVVSISGGPDSVALLRVMHRLAKRCRLEVAAFHLNHRLRGDQSDEDERFVRQLCERHGLALDVESSNVANEARSVGGNLEDVGRRIRRRRLLAAAKSRKAVAATGHTLSDQAETMLMKLCRGSGVVGLASIYPKWSLEPQEGSIDLVRPLLSVSRQEVLSYLERIGQEYRVDRTNRDLGLDRNWVRNRLIPLVEDRLNPRFVETVGRTAILFEEIAALLSKQAEAIQREAVEVIGEDCIIHMDLLSRAPRAVQRSLLHQMLESRISSEVEFGHVEAVLQLIDAQVGREIQLPEGFSVFRERGALRLTRRSKTPLFRQEVEVPGDAAFPDLDKRMILRLTDEDSSGLLLALPERTVIVRNRRPGDRYRPGRGPSRKLKKLLSENGIPRPERDRLLLLECGGVISWVEGFEPDSRYVGTSDHATCVEVLLSSETSR